MGLGDLWRKVDSTWPWSTEIGRRGTRSQASFIDSLLEAKTVKGNSLAKL